MIVKLGVLTTNSCIFRETDGARGGFPKEDCVAPTTPWGSRGGFRPRRSGMSPAPATSTALPQNKNKMMTQIPGFFNGTKFRCAHMGHIRFPKRTQNVTDRFLSRFWVCFHFKSPKTARYWVFYDKIILNLRVSFLFKRFLFIGKSVRPLVACVWPAMIMY